jgi:hypothetical protein
MVTCQCSGVLATMNSNRDGVHVIHSGENACAAMLWMVGWPAHSAGPEGDDLSEQLTDIEHRAEVVPPEGTSLPQRGVPTSQIEACWVLQEIRDKGERPVKVPDARKVLELTCSSNAADLTSVSPTLSAIGRVSLNWRARELNFFGVRLVLVPHAGSAYLAISRDFAVTLQKRTGAYSIVLPDGRTLNGTCDLPTDG